MNTSSPQPNPSVVAILQAGRTGSGLTSRSFWIATAALTILAISGYLVARSRAGAQGLHYETETVTRGNLVVTVSATGTLEPINKVDVGSELSGLIAAVLVGENDHVKKGQVLAELDLSLFNDQVAKSQSTLASAGANVLQALATTKETRANLEHLHVVSRLSGGKVPSQTEMEAAEAKLARAIADEDAARATVKQARATLSYDQRNLSKATIRSPIDGIVLERKKEPGQTVAAAFETPVLFTLAEDLSQMELQVKVDEADVGQVHAGQLATFKVDAYPARRYPARLSRVNFGSETTDGVVTYKTILTVNNDDLTLRPGMTATAEITTATRENVLLIPNGALRFTPPTESGRDEKSAAGIVSSLIPHPPPQEAKKHTASISQTAEQRVWILRDGRPKPVTTTVGVSNGRYTELAGEELAAGERVVTGIAEGSGE